MTSSPQDSGNAREDSKAAVDAAAVVKAAVTATRKTSAHTKQTIDTSGEGQTYRFTVTGGFDFARDRGRLSARLQQQPAVHVEEVLADGNVYIRGAADLDAKDWGVLPRAKAESHYALRAPVNDPEYLLQQISRMRNVSEEGTQTVEGVRITRYRGTLNHAALTYRMAADVRDKVDRTRELLDDGLPVFAEVWVDPQGRVSRTRTELNLAGAQMTVTLSLLDIGKPVEVNAPTSAAVPVGESSGSFLG
ncbi:LppX_LprAFG lipoprotein [Streptomyces sp. NPDC059568]|uniref:LppX_LprAFG lipoprotein n=1 Tax=Streptomyces sp. NPDC059568 TaxID=3346868 RepID=UPI0036765D78